MPTLTKLFTMHEAAQHNSKDDCWIVIDGKVYDVSSYMDEHPGGDDILLAATGKDSTDDFEDAGHSKTARELMETFCIGELDLDGLSSTPTIPELVIVKKNQTDEIIERLRDFTKQYWAVPAAVIGITVVTSFLYSRRN